MSAESAPRDAAPVECRGVRVRLRRAALAEIIALRHAELRSGLGRESAEFDGDHEATTRHFGALLVDERTVRAAATAAPPVAGCASFMRQPYQGEPAYQLRGMATRGDLVGRGIGSALLRYAIADLVWSDTVRTLWCNARLAAVPFYARMGWQVVSDVFDVPTVGPHRVMALRLSEER